MPAVCYDVSVFAPSHNMPAACGPGRRYKNKICGRWERQAEASDR